MELSKKMMNNSIFLESERTFLRPYKRSDAEDISLVASDPMVYATTYNMPLDFTVDYARRWICYLAKNRRDGYGIELGIFEKGTENYIGHCGINSIVKSCKSGNLVYFISRNYWGKGYATEAAKTMLGFGFEQLELERIAGICMEHNTASRRVLEKIGMAYEGCGVHEIYKDDSPVNVLHFAIIKEK